MGVGSGRTIEEADANALSKVSSQITARVRALVKAREVEKNGAVESFAKSVAESMTEGEFARVLIKKRFYSKDEGIWYSLAVVSKHKLKVYLKRRIAEEGAEIEALLQKARELFEEGYISAGMRLLSEAKRKIGKIESIIDVARALEIPETSFSLPQPPAVKLEITEANITPFKVSVRVIALTENKVPAKDIDILISDGKKQLAKGKTNENGEAELFAFTLPTKNLVLIAKALHTELARKPLHLSPSTLTAQLETWDAKDEFEKCLQKLNIKISPNAKVKIKIPPPQIQTKTLKSKLVLATAKLEVEVSGLPETVTFELRGSAVEKSEREAKQKALKKAIAKLCNRNM